MQEFQEHDYSEKLNINIWKKLVIYMLSLKKQVIIGIVAVILLAVGDITFPLLNRWVIDEITKSVDAGTKLDLNYLKLFVAAFVTLSVFQGMFIYTFIKAAGTIEVELSYALRKAAFEKLQSLSFSYFNKTPIGWIMARVTSDAKRLSEIISWGLIDMSWGIMIMIGIVIVMFSINAKLALITLAVVPILVVISFVFRKLLLKLYRDVRKINSKITGSFNEGITGAKTSKTLVLEDKNLREFDRITNSMRTKSIRAAMISSLFFPLVLMFNFVGTALAIYYGGLTYLQGAISIGTLSLFISYSTQFFDPILQLARVLSELQQAQASAERIISLLEVEPEIVDREEVIAKYGDYLNPKRANWETINGDIEFDHVSFQYKNGERVLEDFNLKVKAGETIALVGETGAGKSTIVNLICRFFEPTAGKILIDGIDYKDRTVGWLHSNLGYVLQSPHLFSGTIMENIRYGRLDATDEEVMEAAKLVDAHEFIINAENGYQTEVGEGGGRLSTGQKQLISFARAILANPAIFLLDEATSSIDTETERKVQTAIHKLLEGRTSFIIAHRLSTIVNSDKIIVIKSGKIIEQGSHSQLINEKGYYYRLYTNQFIEEQTQKLGF
ncbi:MAG: transporter related [Haloplasmataceae bacterium]|jgi:ATP-binding cassette subfamily B protein|nr:transporter related [Haloplasmataceae bacterium]